MLFLVIVILGLIPLELNLFHDLIVSVEWVKWQYKNMAYFMDSWPQKQVDYRDPYISDLSPIYVAGDLYKWPPGHICKGLGKY
jgi:hypothetical protein